MTVVVVGGGITGLVTAYDLARAGIPTTLLEESGRLGGKVQTTRVDGCLIESGPDSFIRYRPDAVALVRELGLEGALLAPSEPRTVHVVTGGRPVLLPEGMGLGLPSKIGPLVRTDMFSIPEKLRMGLDVLLPRGPLDDDVAIGSLLRRRLGDALVDRLAGPLLGGVYGTPIDELSLLAVAPQLRSAERDHRSLLLATRASGRAARGSGGAGSPFVTLAEGVGQLVDALVEALHASERSTVRLEAAVGSIELRDGGADVLLTDGEAIRADAVVIATPGPVAARLLERAAPAAAAAVGSIPHGSTAVVTLAYDRSLFPAGFSGHGFIVARGEPGAVDACTFSSLKWAGRAPSDTVLLRAFLGSRRPELLEAPDEALARAAQEDLAGLVGVAGSPHLTRVARWRDCMPQYTVGHLDRVARARAALDGTPLLLAGAPYRGAGLPDCIAQGRAAAVQARDIVEPGRVAPSGSRVPA